MKKFLIAAPLAVAISVFGGLLGINSNVGAAAPSTTDTNIETSAWITDRTAPTGGYTQTGNSVQMTIEAVSKNTTNYWLNWEGIKQSIGKADVISGYISVDPTINNYNVGIWSEAYNNTDELSAYPMIQYCGNVNGCEINDGYGNTNTKIISHGWNLYNILDGSWISAGVATVGLHKIDIAIDQNVVGGVEYYIDNVKVGTVSDPNSPLDYLGTIILHAYNDGTSDYVASYDSLIAGVYNSVENIVEVTKPTTTTSTSNDGEAKVTIDRTNDSSTVQEDITYTVDAIDDSGKVVDSKTVTIGFGDVDSVVFTDLAPGVYTFSVNGVSVSGVVSSWLSDEHTIAAGPAPEPTVTIEETETSEEDSIKTLTYPNTGFKQTQNIGLSLMFAIFLSVLLAGVSVAYSRSDIK